MAWLTDIRTDAITRIVAATTSAGGRVQDSRVRGISVGTTTESGAAASTVDTLPLVVVGTRGLRRDPHGSGSRYVTQTCQLVIACYAAAPASTPADALADAETLEEEVFDALRSDGEWLRLYESPPRMLQGEADVAVLGANVVAMVTQVWELTAMVERAAPANPDALETVVATLWTDPQPEIVARVDGLDE